MTKAQILAEIGRQLSEYLDGYALVGVVAGKEEIVVLARTKTTPQTKAIEVELLGLLDDIKIHNTRKS